MKEITDGAGVPVVYDSVGKDTFMKSLDCLRPRGLMVLFGQSSGSVPPLDLGILAAKGSLYVTRPTLFVYTAKRDDLVTCAADLFEVVHSGDVKIEVRQTFPLRDAAEAHRALEGRATKDRRSCCRDVSRETLQEALGPGRRAFQTRTSFSVGRGSPRRRFRRWFHTAPDPGPAHSPAARPRHRAG